MQPKMRDIREIIVHCSATPEGKHFTVADIDAWHKKRGFKCIGYHFVIYLDGSVNVGRNIEEIGAHCLGHNANSIGICYIGGCAAGFRPQAFTDTMILRLKPAHRLTSRLRDYANCSSFISDFALLVPLEEACTV